MFGREPTHIPLLARITASLILDASASLRTLQEVRGCLNSLLMAKRLLWLCAGKLTHAAGSSEAVPFIVRLITYK